MVRITTVDRVPKAPRTPPGGTSWVDREYPRTGTTGIIRLTELHGIRAALMVTVQKPEGR
jgi:hypothetical protein